MTNAELIQLSTEELLDLDTVVIIVKLKQKRCSLNKHL
jgi:uncharacterized membrane protein